LEKIITILKLLKPKYYNKITYIIVFCGTSLFTKPLWLEFVNWVIEATNQNYKKLTMPIIGHYDCLIGLFLIIVALILNTYNRMIDLKSLKESVPAYKNVNETDFETIEDVCQVIYPILKDNEYIFKTIGPNSDVDESNNLRIDLTLWYKYRSESIAPNNEKIKKILKSNSELFDREATQIIKRMILHIDAFETHLRDETYDYSEYKFPIEFKNFVEKTSFNYNLNSNYFKKIRIWLKKKLKFVKQIDWYLFGSSLFMAEKSKDFDIVIYFNTETKNSYFRKLEDIKIDFKIKFKKNLHLTIFQIVEREAFNYFIKFNEYKVNKNG